MAKFDKKTALAISGAVVVIIIVLLFAKKSKTIVYQSDGQSGPVIIGGVSLPGLTMDIPRYDFAVPAFALPPDQFSMISGCCSDCSKSTPTASYLPQGNGATFVFNEGNTGGAVYNYYQAPAVQPAQTMMIGSAIAYG